MMDNVDLNLLNNRLGELLKLSHAHTEQLVAMGKWQRRIDVQLEELADEVKVQGAMLMRVEHRINRIYQKESEK